MWKATAILIADGAGGNNGEISFKQTGPLNPILVNINATGLSMGKHAIHIHAYGDLREGCKSTGPHIRGILVSKRKINLCKTCQISIWTKITRNINDLLVNRRLETSKYQSPEILIFRS